MCPVIRKATSLTCNVSFMQRTWAILDAKGSGRIQQTAERLLDPPGRQLCAAALSPALLESAGLRRFLAVWAVSGRQARTQQQQFVLVSLAV